MLQVDPDLWSMRDYVAWIIYAPSYKLSMLFFILFCDVVQCYS